MKKVACLALVLVFFALSSGALEAEERNDYPYRTELGSDVFCYEEPDVYSMPLALLPKQEVAVTGEADGGWVLISTYMGELWIQPAAAQYYMENVFDTYSAPDGKVLSENFLPQVVVIYETKDGWLRIDPFNEVWVKPALIKDSIIFTGKSWNQYTDNRILAQKTQNACELYAAASAMNSLSDGYVDHPVQLIGKVKKAANPYDGFNENYGMYAQPLADFINNTYSDDFAAFNATGIGVEHFKSILAANGRIVVWLNTGKNVYSSAGGVRVLLSSHTIAVVGVDGKNVYVTDSSRSGGVAAMSRRSFESAFAGYYPEKNMCVVITAKDYGDNVARRLAETLPN